MRGGPRHAATEEHGRARQQVGAAFPHRTQPGEEPGQPLVPPDVVGREDVERLGMRGLDQIIRAVAVTVPVAAERLERPAPLRPRRGERDHPRAVGLQREGDELEHRVDVAGLLTALVGVGGEREPRLVHGRLRHLLEGQIRLHPLLDGADGFEILVELPLVRPAELVPQGGGLLGDEVEDADAVPQTVVRIDSHQLGEDVFEVEIGQHRLALPVERTGHPAAVGPDHQARPAGLPADRLGDVLVDGDGVGPHGGVLAGDPAGDVAGQQVGPLFVPAHALEMLEPREDGEPVADRGERLERRREFVVATGLQRVEPPHVHAIGHEHEHGPPRGRGVGGGRQGFEPRQGEADAGGCEEPAAAGGAPGGSGAGSGLVNPAGRHADLPRGYLVRNGSDNTIAASMARTPPPCRAAAARMPCRWTSSPWSRPRPST